MVVHQFLGGSGGSCFGGSITIASNSSTATRSGSATIKTHNFGIGTGGLSKYLL